MRSPERNRPWNGLAHRRLCGCGTFDGSSSMKRQEWSTSGHPSGNQSRSRPRTQVDRLAMNWSTAPGPPMSCWSRSRADPPDPIRCTTSRPNSSIRMLPSIAFRSTAVCSGPRLLDQPSDSDTIHGRRPATDSRPRGWLSPSDWGRLSWAKRIIKRLVDISLVRNATPPALDRPDLRMVVAAGRSWSHLGAADFLQTAASRPREDACSQCYKFRSMRCGMPKRETGPIWALESRRHAAPEGRRLAAAHEYRRVAPTLQRDTSAR